MQRRRFILLSGLGATLVYFPFSGCQRRDPLLDKALAQPYMLVRLCDAKTLRDLGVAYRKTAAGETTQQQLADLLLRDESGKTLPSTRDTVVVQDLLEKKILADFRSGNTVTLQGWVLARTEARQCALFSLQFNNIR
jgi:hypothetical protein